MTYEYKVEYRCGGMEGYYVVKKPVFFGLFSKMVFRASCYIYGHKEALRMAQEEQTRLIEQDLENKK